MKLDQRHITMIGVAISAIVAVFAIIYYRNQASAAAQQSSSVAGGSFPYFQTAALPTGTPALSSTTSGSATPAATPDPIASLVSSLAQGQSTALQAFANVAATAPTPAATPTNDLQSFHDRVIAAANTEHAGFDNIPGVQQDPTSRLIELENAVYGTNTPVPTPAPAVAASSGRGGGGPNFLGAAIAGGPIGLLF